MYCAGQVWDEYVTARDYSHARTIVLARNPGCKIIGVTAVFE